MGLVGGLLKTAFAVTYPKKAARLAHAKYDMKHSYAPRVSAVGVALLALPVGYMLGRMSRRAAQVPRYPALERDYNTLPETWE